MKKLKIKVKGDFDQSIIKDIINPMNNPNPMNTGNTGLNKELGYGLNTINQEKDQKKMKGNKYKLKLKIK